MWTLQNMSSPIKPLALVYGATGNTGKVIVDGLLRSGAFRVAIISRSSSRPEVLQYRERGVDVRIVDVASAVPAELKEVLAGVEFIVSVVTATVLDLQRVLFEAAKEAGVKRVIPSDFASACPPGVRHLHDQKLAIRDYIRALGIPYTFVDVGWWMQLAFPYPPSVDRRGHSDSNVIYGSGTKKNALTNLEHVGDYVARVLQDERTINQMVFFWEVEVTAQEVWDVVKRTADDAAAILATKRHVSDEELRTQLDAAIVAHKHEPSQANTIALWISEYAYSIYVRGDNTVEHAKSLGALDARELYPDLKPPSLEEYAKAFYGKFK